LAALFSSNLRREFVAAGPLSNAHAQILSGDMASDRCQQCHRDSSDFQVRTGEAVPKELSRLISHDPDRLFPEPHFQTQSEKCQNCHLRDMPNLARRSPHDLTREELLTIGQKVQRESKLQFVSTTRPLMDWQNRTLECSACHREHQGSMHDLQQIADAKCQVCHQSQFEDFESSHPEFKNYPPPRSRHIAFDHASHRDTHFGKSNATFDCRQCHVTSQSLTAVGQVTASVSYESCRRCHDDGLESSMADGLVVFQLPSFDMRRLTAENAGFEWPVSASQGNDGVVPAVMQIWLHDRARQEGWLDDLPPRSHLAQLDFSTRRDRIVAAKLASASRELLLDIARGGQPAIESKLNELLTESLVNSAQQRPSSSTKMVSTSAAGSSAETVDRQRLKQFVKGIPPQIFQQAYTEWFGRGPSAISKSESLEQERSIAKNADRTARETPSSRSRGSSVSRPQDVFRLTAADDDLLSGDIGSLLGDDPLDGDALGSDLLGDDPLNDDLLGGDLLSDKLLESDLLEGGSSDLNESPPDDVPSLRIHDAVAAGGWFIDSRRMAIVYRPTGHADDWLAAWTDLAAALDRQPPNQSAKFIGQSLLSSKSAGNCTECHLPGLQASSTLARIALERDTATEPWRAKTKSVTIRQLNRFDHTPHLLLPGLVDCQACHSLSAASEAANLPGRSVVDGHSEFESLSVQTCVQCHQQGAAPNSCTTCHNYHVDELTFDVTRPAERMVNGVEISPVR
jgi:hypothetical protein